ncbi:MAG TPA: hypothetical protein VMX14_13395 [Anaerolineae bacterium]|nr:hypothetical protein [Anaerolineae bacterium]
MAILNKEFVQREWSRPGMNVYRQPGDLSSLTALLPDQHGLLRRTDAWSTILDLGAGIQNIRGGFWDDANNTYVVIGQDTATPATKIVLTYFSSTWTIKGTIYDVTSATASLGGKDQMNVSYWGGDLYVIGADKKVYRGSDYTGGLTEFYGTADAWLLFPAGDRMYMITEAGTVYRLNATDDAFETHYTPIGSMDIQYATPFRGYLLLFATRDDGSMAIYRLPDAATATPKGMQQIATVPGSGDLPDYGVLFAHFRDEIYFSPGRLNRFDSTRDVPIYAFNGTQITLTATVTAVPVTANDVTGLVAWQNNLVFYNLDTGGDQVVKVLLGDGFADLPILSPAVVSGYVPWISVLSSTEIVMSGNHATSGEGVYHLGGTHETANTDLADGTLITAWLDMSSPGKQKYLNSITVLLTAANANVEPEIYYRLNGATDWTTATTTANVTRANTENLKASFFTLQVRVIIDDNNASASKQDIRIDALSVRYSIAE